MSSDDETAEIRLQNIPTALKKKLTVLKKTGRLGKTIKKPFDAFLSVETIESPVLYFSCSVM